MSKNIVFEAIFMVWRLRFGKYLDGYRFIMDISVCIVNLNSIKQRNV